MHFSRSLLVVIFLVILKQNSSAPVEKSDEDDDIDVNLKLLKLLPQVIEDSEADFSNSNSNFNKLSYNPDLIVFPDDFDTSEEGSKEFFDDGWYNSDKEPINDNDFEQNDSGEDSNEFGAVSGKKSLSYEVTEIPEEDYTPHNHEKRQFYPGFRHNHGFHYGFNPQPHYNNYAFHHHHNHDFYQHGADCFPHGNRRRPRPPPPPQPPTTSTPFPSVDPRIPGNTPAGIVSTEAPGIDIRFGRDRRSHQNAIVFPE